MKLHNHLFFLMVAVLVLLPLGFSADLRSVDYEYLMVKQAVPHYEWRATPYPGFCESINLTCHETRFEFSRYLSFYSYVWESSLIRNAAYIDGKMYRGAINKQDGKIYRWKVPVGDRNYEEFGTCLPHEIKKGVCEIVR